MSKHLHILDLKIVIDMAETGYIILKIKKYLTRKKK